MVIPVLDEAPLVSDLVASLPADADEVVFVDGGSSDGTSAILDRLGYRVERAPRGRGAQLSVGAARATGAGLVFLHADTRLPEGALGAVREALSAGSAGGAFRLSYDEPRTSLRIVAAAANLRSRLFRMPFGDQALFASRDAYAACGGFRPLPLMEDVDFVARLRRIGPFRILPMAITTSARRFRRHGIVRTVLRDWACQAGWKLGVPPERLGSFYERKARGSGSPRGS